MANWGIMDPTSLIWLTPPPPSALKQGKEVLEVLGSLVSQKITKKGKEMLRYPTHPRIAHLLMEGQGKGLTALACDVAAILEEKDPLPKEVGADLAYRVEVLRKWRNKEYVNADKGILERIERSAAAWRRICKIEVDNSSFHYEKVGYLLATAYPERVAKQKEKDTQRYRLANGRVAKLPSQDALGTETWLAIAQMDAGSTEGKIFLAAPLNISDFEHLLERKRVVAWDSQKGQLIARMERCFGDITVQSTPLEEVPEDERVAVLCQAIQQEGFALLPWTEEVRQWQSRLLSLRRWRPQEEWPDFSTDYLLETVDNWLAPYLEKIKKREDFKKLDLFEILKSALSWETSQRLETLVPEKIHVPSGFEVALHYSPEGNDPVLAVRLQEMFGLLDTPTINEGRTKVVLHLLSPGYKPVQVTQDLRSFWQNAYPEVRKQLRMRYPRHSWPEDPWTAEAVRGAKKR
jgi:ATP-dependent helicase HrpB